MAHSSYILTIYIYIYILFIYFIFFLLLLIRCQISDCVGLIFLHLIYTIEYYVLRMYMNE